MTDSNALWLLASVVIGMCAVVGASRLGTPVLMGLHCCLLLSCNIFSTKAVEVFGWTITAGTPLYGVTFLVTDIVAEKRGKAAADIFVIAGFGVLLLFNVLVIFVLQTDSVEKGADFDGVMGITPRLFAASVITYLLAQLLDVRVFHRIRERTAGAMPWLRNIGSTFISQAVDSLCFFSLAFAGTELNWIELAVTGYFAKLLVGLIDTPFFYWGRAVARLGPHGTQ